MVNVKHEEISNENDVAPEIKNGPSKRISTHYVNAKALLFPPSSHGKQTVLFGFYFK